MKVLIIARFFYPPAGGAELSLLTLAEELTNKHSVFALCYGENENRVVYKQISIHYKNLVIKRRESYLRSIFNTIRWRKTITQEVKTIKPDLILTQLVLSPMAVKVAKKFGIPTILSLHSYEPFCFISFVNGINCDKKCFKCFKTTKEKLKHLFFRKELKHYEYSLKKANLVIANGKFMRDICSEWYGVNSVIIPPFIRLADYICENKKSTEYITFISPSIIKGANIFLKLATVLKDRKFLVVSGLTDYEFKGRFEPLPNVKWIPKTENMRKVYEKTRVLIVPSICPEPFGRVCVEAMSNGIPCIVSKRGGLPEVVGEGGVIIENPYNIDLWVESIEALDGDDLYYKLSRKAKEQASKFDIKYTYKEFIRVVSSLTYA